MPTPQGGSCLPEVQVSYIMFSIFNPFLISQDSKLKTLLGEDNGFGFTTSPELQILFYFFFFL